MLLTSFCVCMMFTRICVRMLLSSFCVRMLFTSFCVHIVVYEFLCIVQEVSGTMVSSRSWHVARTPSLHFPGTFPQLPWAGMKMMKIRLTSTKTSHANAAGEIKLRVLISRRLCFWEGTLKHSERGLWETVRGGPDCELRGRFPILTASSIVESPLLLYLVPYHTSSNKLLILPDSVLFGHKTVCKR